ncbi:hypothetical protein P171DRAFT_515672 [Karstenula rhodostoma CBS 690.94]|uniref:Uncharacterized protein n=1 Tax=Karstenula rhodostoma CBS 690.94 TaxID=1392251 RepID=A0A9P4PZF9_9PLEO|nr:hypothetical protein P171DRAFT_515672 [Karstenula rhodostoma CBS 690.94]
MIAIHSANAKKCTPNLLPARLNHNGPVNDTAQYWKPEIDEEATPHAYFRGRHLHGTPLALPSTHTGAVLQITDKNLPQTRTQPADADEEEEEQETVEVKVAEQIGEFEEVVVWGHGGQVEEGQDMFIRGMKEWIGFAEAMHGEDGDGDGEGKEGTKTS